MLQFAERRRLDLPDSLARHPEDFADLFQRIRNVGIDAVAQLDDLPIAVAQLRQDLFQPLPNGSVIHAVHMFPLVIVLIGNETAVPCFAQSCRTVSFRRMPR